MDPDVVDEWVRVSDRESFRWARRLAREEGLLARRLRRDDGVAAVQFARAARPGQARAHDRPRLRAQLPVEVLRRQLDARARLPRAPGAAADGRGGAAREARRRAPDLVTISAHQKVGEGIDTMQRYGISQLPVVARRRVRVARGRDRLAPGSRAARARVHRIPTCCTRTSRRRCSRRSPRSSRPPRLEEVFATLSGGSNAVVVARTASRSAC